MPKVKFLREKKEIEVPLGANLRDAAMKAGIELYPGIHAYLNCHGNGMCHSCRVLLKNGTMRNASKLGFWEMVQEATAIYSTGCEDEVRLACQTHVDGDLEVETQPAMNWSGEFKQ